MKVLTNEDVLSSSTLIKISAFGLLCFTFFFVGRHWSGGYQQIVFYGREGADSAPSVSVSKNADIRVDSAALIFSIAGSIPPSLPPLADSFPPIFTAADSSPPALPPHLLQPPATFGIVDQNGTMASDFEVGDFDPNQVVEWGNTSVSVVDGDDRRRGQRIEKFPLCSDGTREYIPCLDNEEAIRSLNSTERGERFERHCPLPEKLPKCLVPTPKDYRKRIPWPQSRDEVWFNNVPHNRLVEDKGGQNWITRDGDKFKFPGGGTQFIHGADQYLNQIEEMVPDIAFGSHTRVVLDIGCGVASFGAFLLSRDVVTLSIAPKDVHENQIQFALERGVLAMVAAFATRRLSYPSQAFELIHCSRCRINWTRDDCRKVPWWITLLTRNEVQAAAGSDNDFYFLTFIGQMGFCFLKLIDYSELEATLPGQHNLFINMNRTYKKCGEMESLTASLCWKLVKKEGYIAIWQKPLDNSCYINRGTGAQPPLCDTDDDPDSVWYVDMRICITRLPENGFGRNITVCPSRLHTPPDRLQTVSMDAFVAKKELFKAESGYWNEIIESYVRAFHWKELQFRNVLDMRAGFGGFAAGLIDNKIGCWVMNVVPVSEPNTLPVIYDRGLIGVSHDWCEPFDTYPRTYDLLHASGLFSREQKRCDISRIMLEMDRMLRPGGYAYIRDSKQVLESVHQLADAMGWKVSIYDPSEGPFSSQKILACEKQMLR